MDRLVTMRFYTVLIIFLLQSGFIHGQIEAAGKKKIFQVSLAPGLGTNGMHPGNFVNYVSVNLTSGYSASALLFEIATISNLNTDRTLGFQIAGLANLTGANAYGGLSKKEQEQKLKNGFTSYLTGAQISGLTNIVVGYVYGAQFTGGINLVKGALIGVQLSAFSNIVYKYSFGVQASGLFNVSAASMNGVQLSGFSNYTKGEMAGLQLSLLNQAGDIEGKNSFDNTQPTGVQLGLVNIANRMNGLQIGLVNFAKRSQGTQIGLINFYKSGRLSDSKDGTAIGLLNIGDLGYVSVYMNEIFGLNYEIATGTRKNARIKLDRRNVYVENALIYSHQSFKHDSWGMGYGLKKMFFNRSELPGMTESRFISYGMDVQHINLNAGEITKDLSLLTRLKFMAGKRIAPKLFGVNWFVSMSLNAYWNNIDISIAPTFLTSSSQIGNAKVEYWPGFSVGLLFH